jgi:hypothetical protein
VATRRRIKWTVATAGLCAAVVGLAVIPASATTPSADAWGSGGKIQHVLLLSVDGLHQSDLAWYVVNHPTSTMATLADHGVDYSAASTPVPSDSVPGMIAQVTGGNPSSTGIYYDDTYNHALLPPGTTSCHGQPTGTETQYLETNDINLNSLDAGQGLSGLPNSILSMTGVPEQVIDPKNLVVDPATCKPIYPNQYLKVNTIFEVARAHNLVTAWSDKHPSYQMLDGPSGTGVQDFFTPEINSQAAGLPAGQDWTTDNAKTQQYDSYKVQAVLNWIDGYDHNRSVRLGTPAIFGMNFQTVSTAQKLPTSDGLKGGYLSDGATPGPLLSRALDFINTSLTAMVSHINSDGLAGSTTIILSAKHGQSPMNPAALTRIPDGPIVTAINAAWTAAHPGAPTLVVQATDDDGMLLWLSNRSQAAADFVKNFLLNHSGTGNDINGAPKAYTHSGLTAVYGAAQAASYFNVPVGDPRVPDVFGVAQYGTVFTGGQAKIAEHGGAGPQDRNVPILISGPTVPHDKQITAPVETTQIAPTILDLLGLKPRELQAVQIEHTQVLP